MQGLGLQHIKRSGKSIIVVLGSLGTVEEQDVEAVHGVVVTAHGCLR